MFDSISDNKSKKDVSKENRDNLKESIKSISDDAVFTNCNFSNSIDDFSINEMNLPISFPSIVNNIDDNNPPIPNLTSPIITEEPNIPSSKKNIIKNNNKYTPYFTTKKKKNPKNKNNNNDNRKLKKAIIDSSLEFINYKIRKTYNNNIGNGINKKKLFKINSNYVKNFGAEFNKQLLETTLGEIFSCDISGNYTSFLKDFNKKLINNLLNEEDLKKRKIFENLFSKTFLECINHILGKKRINELQGLEQFFENEVKDREALKKLLNNFEEIISLKRPRKSKNM